MPRTTRHASNTRSRSNSAERERAGQLPLPAEQHSTGPSVQLLKNRNKARQVADELANQAVIYLSDDNFKDVLKYKSVLLRLKRSLAKLIDFDHAIQCDLDGDVLDQDIEDSSKNEETVADIISQIEPKIDLLVTDAASQPRGRIHGANNNAPGNGQHNSKVKLPKLQIPLFSGDPCSWKEFWETFESNIHKNDSLTETEKFQYLRGYMAGEAAKVISHYPTTAAHYREAIQSLKDFYEDSSDTIIESLRKLQNLKISNSNAVQLRDTLVEVGQHIRALISLGENCDNMLTLETVRSKFPYGVLLDVEKLAPPGGKWNMARLIEALQTVVKSRQRASPGFVKENSPENAHSKSGKFKSQSQPENKFKSTGGALLTHQSLPVRKQPPFACVFCRGAHWADECNKFVTIESRKKQLKGRCQLCLSSAHKSQNCDNTYKPCFHCKMKGVHHCSLCPTKGTTETMHVAGEVDTNFDVNSSNEDSNDASFAMMATGDTIFMQTADVTVSNGLHQQRTVTGCRTMLDSGSHRTYITARLVNELQLQALPKEKISLCTFGSKSPKTIWAPKVNLQIKLSNGRYLELQANVVPQITGSISRAPLDDDIRQQMPSPPAQANSTVSNHEIDLLIGNDHYLDLAKPMEVRPVRRHPNLYFMRTQLGWILSGRSTTSNKGSEAGLLCLTYPHESDSQVSALPNVEQYFTLENIGISDCPYTTADDKALDNFNDTLKFDHGRYSVTWPWIEDDPQLPTNYWLAFGRFKTLIKNKLAPNPDVLRKYTDIIEDQHRKGIIEKVPFDDGSVPNQNRQMLRHYIPHHPVITPLKTTTKVRIVYDASAKLSSAQPSLNESLYRGPVLLQNLVGILLRFRLHKVTAISDIEKAFLQVSLQETERDVTRFFYLSDPTVPKVEDNVQIYRFCRVPFGINTSPFLLNGSVAHHCKTDGRPFALQILRDIYVDNVITGLNSVDEATQFYNDSKELFAAASMNLREWCSNSDEFLAKIPNHDKASGDTIKVLGVPWNRISDNLEFLYDLNPDIKTRREALQSMSKFYDPLGLFCPLALKAKIFLQSLSGSSKDWDAQLTTPELEAWHTLSTVNIKSQFLLPRLISNMHTPEAKYQLHVFGDASTTSYAAVAYLRTTCDNRIECKLIYGKSRIAPRKQITVPRLELLGALLSCRMTNFLREQLPYNLDDAYVWCDSTCVLSWIPSRKLLPTFVENRLKEIRGIKNVKFTYVSTDSNPADLATRGCNASELKERQMWWNGPAWLSDEPSHWPQHNDIPDGQSGQLNNQEGDSYITGISLVASESSKTASDCGDISAFSDISLCDFSALPRLLKVTAWVVRFANKLTGRHAPSGKALEPKELEDALQFWLQRIQFAHYGNVIEAITANTRCVLKDQLGLQVDEHNLLRCHGRLGNASLTLAAKQLILLPKNSHLTVLIIDSCHKQTLHAGVSQRLSTLRARFWVPQGRAQVKRVLRNCIICRKMEGGPFKPPEMPSFPSGKVTQHAPYTYTGIDYFGPLYVVNANDGTESKTWVLLLTCMTVRAVHFELAKDMTAKNC